MDSEHGCYFIVCGYFIVCDEAILLAPHVKFAVSKFMVNDEAILLALQTLLNLQCLI